MSKIVGFLQRFRDQRAFSGAVYAVGDSETVFEQGAAGTLAWDGEPVDLSSMWDLASVTKPIVALTLMVFLERGEVCLDDTIEHFLPEYAHTEKAGLTLYQLLSHTSGIPGQQPLYQTVRSKEDLMTAVRNLPLRFKPGTNVEYTSQGFMILGDIIETVGGGRLEAILKETVLEPLKMRETTFRPAASEVRRIAATEDCPWRGRIVRGEVHDENAVVLGGIAGHAGLFSTVGDMIRLCQAMLRLGATEEGRFLHPDTVKLMTRNWTAHLPLARGLGWQAKDAVGSPGGDLFSVRSYGHTGFTGTSIWIDPERDRFAVLLTNRVHPTRDNASIKRVRAMFHNLACLMER
jgi:CubicO group peptidase (beta-lactamase class C family)